MAQRKRFLARFINDDSGQDLIEYGLLLGIIGISAVLIMPTIQTKMAAEFLRWGTQVHDTWWVPRDPLP